MAVIRNFLCCKGLLACGLSLGAVVTSAHAMQTRLLDVSTTIDRSMMLADTVTLEFAPVSATLLFDADLRRFIDQHFALTINTTLDTQDDYSQNGYELILTENNSTCYDGITKSGSTVVAGYESIATIHLGSLSNPMALNEKKVISAFDNSSISGVNAFSEHLIILTYPVISDDSVRYCEGSFVLGFRYNI